MNYIIWLLITILYTPAFRSLYKLRWKTIDYTHAYFILPAALFLVWLKRLQIKELLNKNSSRTGPGSIYLFLFVLGLAMFVFGWKQDYLFIASLSLIPLLSGLTGFLYGKDMVKLVSFPVFYLLLLVPPPLGILDTITLPMRYGTSLAAETFLKALNYTIERNGLLLSIGGHEVFMGEPCSGFRSLITMVALSLLYAHLSKNTFRDKAILVSSVIPVALAGNALRVTGVCLAAFYFGDTFAHKFHDASGYGIFLLLILGMIGLETLLTRHK